MGGVGVDTVGVEEASEEGHGNGQVVAGVDVGAGGGGGLGALVVGADEAATPGHPREVWVGVGDVVKSNGPKSREA